MYLQSNNINLICEYRRSPRSSGRWGRNKDPVPFKWNKVGITTRCRHSTNELWTNVFIMHFLKLSWSWPLGPYGLLNPHTELLALTSVEKEKQLTVRVPSSWDQLKPNTNSYWNGNWSYQQTAQQHLALYCNRLLHNNRPLNPERRSCTAIQYEWSFPSLFLSLWFQKQSGV